MTNHDVRWNPPRPETTGAASAVRPKSSGDPYAWIVVLLLVACTTVALFDLYLLYGGAH